MSTRSRSDKKPAKPLPKPRARIAKTVRVAAPKPGKIKYDAIPKVEKKRAGRPRKDGQPPRERKKMLPIKVRREIKEMLIRGDSVATIQYRFRRYKPSAHQIENIKYGRTKTVKSKRKDAHDSTEGADTPVLSGRSVSELLHANTLRALEDLDQRESVKPVERIVILEKAARVDRHVKATELEAHIKRADASIIKAIVRRYEPEASDDRVIKIYREELAKIQQDLASE